MMALGLNGDLLMKENMMRAPSSSVILNYEVSYLSIETAGLAFFDVGRNLEKTIFLKSQSPPISYFLYLYRTVGRKYEWTDWLIAEKNELKKFLFNKAVTLYSLIYEGVPRGFYVLDFRKPFVCDLAYFGLFDEIIGKGYGKLMMNRAFETILEYGDIKNITVNTNTLDHVNALAFYKKAGFGVIRVEEHHRKAFGDAELKGDFINV